jgi:nitroimidazol reductase NimA-like FMN-containing flavoprotein (pyridoxamine 5'-phosphate oxidase superfamily)
MTSRGGPSARMTPAEIWRVVSDAHTGIFTTLTSDGSPISLPIWFVAIDQEIYMSTRGKKVGRVQRNPVSSFLVEGGERWADLHAVHMSGRSEIVQPAKELADTIQSALDRKYSAYRNAPANGAAYAPAQSAIVRFTPGRKILNWDNAKLTSR